MIERQTIEELAARLRDAYRGDTLAPMRAALDPTDADRAYAIQAINTRFWLEQGRRIVGRKAGLTNPAVQQQLGVDQPDYGVLFEDMRIADEGMLEPSRTIQPKAEAEIAFVLSSDLPGGVANRAAMLHAVRSAHAAIEIVDSRIADWKITFADTVADNGSSAFFVMAESGIAPDSVALDKAAMAMTIDGEEVSTGTGAAVLGHPLDAAAWLANTLAEHGDPLKAGDILLAGAMGPMVTLSPGNVVRARIGGVGECGFTYGGKS